MLAPDTKDLGEALAFGSALLFSSVFGKPFTFMYLCFNDLLC